MSNRNFLLSLMLVMVVAAGVFFFLLENNARKTKSGRHANYLIQRMDCGDVMEAYFIHGRYEQGDTGIKFTDTTGTEIFLSGHITITKLR